MPFGPALGAVASIGGGLLSANAASKAASQQAAQFQQAISFQQGVYGNTVENLQPFVGAGTDALSQLRGFYGLPGGNAGGAIGAFNNFTQTPSYQFPLQQGTLAMNRQLASSGLTGSGGALRDSNALAQGYASQGLGGYLTGLGSLASLGQNSAALTGSQGNTAASTLLQGFTGLGNAQAAGTIGSANAINQGIQGALPYITGSPNGGTLPFGGSSYSSGGGLIGSLGSLFGGGGGNNGFVDSGTFN
jgi:hypothetical protein